MKIKTAWWLLRGQNYDLVPNPDFGTLRWKGHEFRRRYSSSLVPGRKGTYYVTDTGIVKKDENYGPDKRVGVIDSQPRMVKVKVMSNTFIVNSTLDMMDAGDMTEKWVPISKNTFKFADITVDPEGITFDNQRFKMSFMQRMKFLRAYGALQEYYAVKKFRDSIQGALECSPAQSKLAAS